MSGAGNGSRHKHGLAGPFDSRFYCLCSLRSITAFLFSLFTVHYSLFTVHYSLFTLRCSLFIVLCSLFTVHCSLFTVHYSLFTLCSKSHSREFCCFLGCNPMKPSDMVVFFCAKPSQARFLTFARLSPPRDVSRLPQPSAPHAPDRTPQRFRDRCPSRRAACCC